MLVPTYQQAGLERQAQRCCSAELKSCALPPALRMQRSRTEPELPRTPASTEDLALRPSRERETHDGSRRRASRRSFRSRRNETTRVLQCRARRLQRTQRSLELRGARSPNPRALLQRAGRFPPEEEWPPP